MCRAAAYQLAFLATIVSTLIWQAEASADVKITHDGPLVVGGTITFKAELLNSDGTHPYGKYIYKWKDNGLIPHISQTEVTKNTTNFYTVSYPALNYPVGQYKMEVVVCEQIWFLGCQDFTSNRVDFRITNLLNGKITIEQSNKTVSSKFVSSAEVAKLSADIRKADLEFINKTATSINVYWFIDCHYVNNSNSFKLNYNFTKPVTFHTIEALVVASYDPPVTTTVAPPTTSTEPTPPSTNGTTHATSNVTSTTPSTTALANTTLKTPTTTSTPNKSNTTLAPPGTLNLPFVCNSKKDLEPNKTYGYFQREVNISAPISNINFDGSTWIEPWTVLSLTVTCNGTGPFDKCVEIKSGEEYKVTGNESCDHNFEKLDSCKFDIKHYFLDRRNYTVVVILSNNIGTVAKPILINVVEFTPQPQLSVIIVPVSCSLVAVVIIVFGIAYYIQNRSRFTIEVADFDFGQRSAEMEYKTFSERLRDSFNNAGYSRMENARDPPGQAVQ